MLWFWKKKPVEPSTSGGGDVRSPDRQIGRGQDLHVLYSLGTIIPVKPSQRFELEDEREGYFLLAKGTAMLRVNGKVDVREVVEGQWLSTGLIPKSGKYSLSLQGGQDFKLLHLAPASLAGIDSTIKDQIEKSIRELYKDIRRSVSSMDTMEQSIGEYVRSSLSDHNKKLVREYEKSNFIKNAIKDISSLPTVTQNLIGLSLSDSISNAEVITYIKNNPSLASEVLKIVNSSYHGFRNKVTDINYAVLYLGLSQIFQIVISVSLQDIASRSVELAGVYQHSIIVSNLMGLLAAPREKRSVPVLSTIGILHDVGEMVKFLIKEKRKDLDMLVDQLSGAKLGSMLLERWQIPEPVCRAIEIHDQSYYTLPGEIGDELRVPISCLHVGHGVCSFIEDPSLPSDPVTDAYLSFLGFEGMSLEQLVRLYLVPELRSQGNKLPVEVQVFFSI